MAKQWTRWQDWVAVVLGVVAALSVIWLETTNAARWSLLVFGVLLLASGVLAVAAGAAAIPTATAAHRIAGQH